MIDVNSIVFTFKNKNVHLDFVSFSLGPYPVHNLTEEQATTNTVTLLWEQLESKPHYSYVVQASSDSIFWSKTCNSTTVTVTGLIPGSRYNFTVISQTADGTRATPVELSSYTRMCSSV